jgi:hypothetical protein
MKLRRGTTLLFAQVNQRAAIQHNRAGEGGRSVAHYYLSRQKIYDDATLRTSASFANVYCVNSNEETNPACKGVRDVVGSI